LVHLRWWLIYFDPFLVLKQHPCFRGALVFQQVLVVFHEPLECIDRLFNTFFADGRATDFMATIIALRIPLRWMVDKGASGKYIPLHESSHVQERSQLSRQ
jgi:hypothetical protein